MGDKDLGLLLTVASPDIELKIINPSSPLHHHPSELLSSVVIEEK